MRGSQKMTFQTLMTFKERTYQGILQIMAFFPCKSSIISLIYDLVKVWYVLRWHQATTSAVRYGTTSALSRFLNSSFCQNSQNISVTVVDDGLLKKELPYVINTKKNCLELSWLCGPCVISARQVFRLLQGWVTSWTVQSYTAVSNEAWICYQLC